MEQQPITPLGASAACQFCGKPLTPDQVLYTADARIACAGCNDKVDLVVGDMRVGHNIRNGAIVSIVLAGCSFLFNPFAILTISSMISAIYALIAVNRKGDERFTQHILKDKGTIYACAIIALVLDGIVLILVILALAAMSTVKHHSSY
jgi:hypothetical protein